jgi:hypothetical protein
MQTLLIKRKPTLEQVTHCYAYYIPFFQHLMGVLNQGENSWLGIWNGGEEE